MTKQLTSSAWRMLHNFFQYFVLIICGMQAKEGMSQQLPAFKPNRYDENYAFLKPDSSHDWYKKTKYQKLSANGDTYISFGGDVRFQYFWFKNEDWGESPADKDGYIFTRWLAHTDFHVNKYVRTFVQLQSSLANGLVRQASPVDENQLDLHQAFVDVSLPLQDKQKLTVRVGRQELSYGSQRLVAVREGPNNRQAFDAAKIMFEKPNLKADAFFSHYVKSKPGIFDDGFNRNTRFWGVYTVINKVPLVKNIDIYYLGLWKSTAVYDNGSGEEWRHSAGARLWKATSTFRYDIEGLYQFGSLGDRKIRAWTLSLNAGYKLVQLPLKPEIGLKTELISGNRSYDNNKLQTFNPLFPRGSYFGLASLVGPSNLYDIHPSLSFDLTRKLFLNFDNDVFWRYSKNDGIYSPGGSLIYSGKSSQHTFIGSQFAADFTYTPSQFLYFRIEFTWFKTGDYLKDVGPGKDILFTGATIQAKF